MFQGLLKRAERSIDSAVTKVVDRALMAAPLVVAGGFATAALTVWLVEHYGHVTAYALMAGAFALIGLITMAVLGVGSAAKASSESAAPEPEQAARRIGRRRCGVRHGPHRPPHARGEGDPGLYRSGRRARHRAGRDQEHSPHPALGGRRICDLALYPDVIGAPDLIGRGEPVRANPSVAHRRATRGAGRGRPGPGGRRLTRGRAGRRTARPSPPRADDHAQSLQEM